MTKDEILQYQIINGKKLDVFMKKYHFQRIPYYGNESDIDYSDIDWEQEFRNGRLEVIDILGF